MRTVFFMKIPRIGLLFNSLQADLSSKLRLNIAEYVSQKNGSLFVFLPAEKNDESSDSEELDEIYSLVNPENLDGLIICSSSIENRADANKLEKFNRQLAELPFVTIGRKIENHVNIAFDEYSSEKEFVQHFIKVHAAKRIAFLRGPKNQKSAEDRYIGFKDAMTEAELFSPENEKLVTENFAWNDGAKAIIQLCDDRGFVPGKDFDVVIASSDKMAFDATELLVKRGFSVPKDVIIGGFNDSLENHVFSVPISTVHVPTEELGIAAFDTLNRILDGEQNISDVNISAYVVIRESCGCNNLKTFISSSKSGVKLKSREQFFNECVSLFRLSDEKKEQILKPLFEFLFANNYADFFKKLSSALFLYFQNNGELSKLFTAQQLLRNSNFLSEESLIKVMRGINIIISKTQGQVSDSRFFDNQKIASVINMLKNKFFSVHDKKNLVNVLAHYLPQIGIKNMIIVLKENAENSKYIGGFNQSGNICYEEIIFPSKLFVPKKYAQDFAQGIFAIQSLFAENKNIGYIISDYSNSAGKIFEDLRIAINSALNSIFLFEKANKAKKIAEQAEFAKTEFFANVGNDLCDPLKDLSAKVSQMENNINNGILDQDILGEQLIFLKSQIESQLEKTETLIDLTRSQIDDLPIDKKLFDIKQILPESVIASLDAKIPLLFGDAEKLKKAIYTIFCYCGNFMQVCPKISGLELIFENKNLDWQRPDLLLAKKIIILQFGEINIIKSYIYITLPWPNLAGSPPEKQKAEVLKIYDLSLKSNDKSLFGIDIEVFPFQKEKKSSANQSLVFYWMADRASIDECVKIYSLRHNNKLFRSPLLCFSRDLVGQSFVEMLEQRVKVQNFSPVLFINTKHTKFGTWATDSNTISIDSISEFDKIINEITPSLIVFEKIEEESIKIIRRNPKTVLSPIIVLPDSIVSEKDVELLCSHPRTVLCNRTVAESDLFNARIHAILDGDEILPPHTGAIVKRAILYLNKHSSQQIVRWKMADTVHVSEDYLTRIFHKEMGLSLWEYLNRYRIYLATKMLLETNDTIYEIAENTGFQDQAYFCRVFKKIYGIPPGKIRTKQ